MNQYHVLTKRDHATKASNAWVHFLNSFHELVASIDINACVFITQAFI